MLVKTQWTSLYVHFHYHHGHQLSSDFIVLTIKLRNKSVYIYIYVLWISVATYSSRLNITDIIDIFVKTVPHIGMPPYIMRNMCAWHICANTNIYMQLKVYVLCAIIG